MHCVYSSSVWQHQLSSRDGQFDSWKPVILHSTVPRIPYYNSFYRTQQHSAEKQSGIFHKKSRVIYHPNRKDWDTTFLQHPQPSRDMDFYWTVLFLLNSSSKFSRAVGNPFPLNEELRLHNKYLSSSTGIIPNRQTSEVMVCGWERFRRLIGRQNSHHSISGTKA